MPTQLPTFGVKIGHSVPLNSPRINWGCSHETRATRHIHMRLQAWLKIKNLINGPHLPYALIPMPVGTAQKLPPRILSGDEIISNCPQDGGAFSTMVAYDSRPMIVCRFQKGEGVAPFCRFSSRVRTCALLELLVPPNDLGLMWST